MRTQLGAASLAAVMTVAGLAAGAPAEAAAKKTTAKALLAQLPVTSELDSFTGFPGSLETWAKSKVSKCKSVREEVLAKESLAPAPKTCVNYNQRAWLDPWLGNRTDN